MILLRDCLAAYDIFAKALRHFDEHRLVVARNGIDRKADTALIGSDHLLDYDRHLKFARIDLAVNKIA